MPSPKLINFTNLPKFQKQPMANGLKRTSNAPNDSNAPKKACAAIRVGVQKTKEDEREKDKANKQEEQEDWI